MTQVWVEGSGIYGLDFTPKPAAAALRALWRQRFNTTVRHGPAAAAPPGGMKWRGHYGRYAYEFFDPAGARHEGAFEVAPERGSRVVTVRLP
jgi:hypothetical protein